MKAEGASITWPYYTHSQKLGGKTNESMSLFNSCSPCIQSRNQPQNAYIHPACIFPLLTNPDNRQQVFVEVCYLGDSRLSQAENEYHHRVILWLMWGDKYNSLLNRLHPQIWVYKVDYCISLVLNNNAMIPLSQNCFTAINSYVLPMYPTDYMSAPNLTVYWHTML